ncbi:hypothetical protein BU25DRAFT_417957 [Macroventuria anomochaeta]|uniref:Uncharacterized protein n=1 Tax=Macroventuria anomochaeta TaxID=301207 RepID=A0ACB6SFZ6_9PLEO|nr:uncharacterized protein BU25DRAFT_417957 [Macroventuria anomochaeta]KAF2632234.1 hypothetical protein BU25DRAFT_417957 [Macroventuria anomochaeta]
MSRRADQVGARPVGSSRDERRRGGGSSRPNSGPGYQHSAHAPVYNSTQSAQHAYPAGVRQPTYEAARARAHPNPEVDRVMNDPRLNSTSAYSQPTAKESYGNSSYQPTNGYQQAYPQYPGSQQSANGNLTAGQLYSYNYGQPSSNAVDTWEDEGQRDGPWYGSVQRG